MRNYLCYIALGNLKAETREIIRAESSFAARKAKATKHTGADVIDIVAIALPDMVPPNA